MIGDYEWNALLGYIEGVREYHKQHEQLDKMHTCDDILEQMECIKHNDNYKTTIKDKPNRPSDTLREPKLKPMKQYERKD